MYLGSSIIEWRSQYFLDSSVAPLFLSSSMWQDRNNLKFCFFIFCALAFIVRWHFVYLRDMCRAEIASSYHGANSRVSRARFPSNFSFWFSFFSYLFATFSLCVCFLDLSSSFLLLEILVSLFFKTSSSSSFLWWTIL